MAGVAMQGPVGAHRLHTPRRMPGCLMQLAVAMMAGTRSAVQCAVRLGVRKMSGLLQVSSKLQMALLRIRRLGAAMDGVST